MFKWFDNSCEVDEMIRIFTSLYRLNIISEEKLDSVERQLDYFFYVLAQEEQIEEAEHQLDLMRDR